MALTFVGSITTPSYKNNMPQVFNLSGSKGTFGKLDMKSMFLQKRESQN
jgi:hypothetical protein